jgi:hypothetical protein
MFRSFFSLFPVVMLEGVNVPLHARTEFQSDIFFSDLPVRVFITQLRQVGCSTDEHYPLE